MIKSKNFFYLNFIFRINFSKDSFPFLSSTNLTKKFNDMNDNKNESMNNSFTFGNRTDFKKNNFNDFDNKNNYSKNMNLNENEENEEEEEKEEDYEEDDSENNNNSHIIFEEISEKDLIKLNKTFYNNKIFKNTHHFVLNTINSNLCELFSSSSTATQTTYNNNNNINNNISNINNQNNNNIKKKLIGNKINNKLILNEQYKKKEEKCKCKNSQCLKLYCECFSNGRTCNNCFCLGCKNTIENEEIRKTIYNEIISKNPKAIQKIKSVKRSWTCHCKNSNCKKNYCDCFQNGKYCSSKCKCVDCQNKNLFNNNKKRRGLDHFPKIKKGKSKKKNNKVDLENSFEKMYTPQKRNYRGFNSDIKNNVSTAAYTQLSKSIENSKKKIGIENKEKNIFKKLNMDELSESMGIFKKK